MHHIQPMSPHFLWKMFRGQTTKTINPPTIHLITDQIKQFDGSVNNSKTNSFL